MHDVYSKTIVTPFISLEAVRWVSALPIHQKENTFMHIGLLLLKHKVKEKQAWICKS